MARLNPTLAPLADALVMLVRADTPDPLAVQHLEGILKAIESQ